MTARSDVRSSEKGNVENMKYLELSAFVGSSTLTSSGFSTFPCPEWRGTWCTGAFFASWAPLSRFLPHSNQGSSELRPKVRNLEQEKRSPYLKVIIYICLSPGTPR